MRNRNVSRIRKQLKQKIWTLKEKNKNTQKQQTEAKHKSNGSFMSIMQTKQKTNKRTNKKQIMKQTVICMDSSRSMQ